MGDGLRTPGLKKRSSSLRNVTLRFELGRNLWNNLDLVTVIIYVRSENHETRRDIFPPAEVWSIAQACTSLVNIDRHACRSVLAALNYRLSWEHMVYRSHFSYKEFYKFDTYV